MFWGTFALYRLADADADLDGVFHFAAHQQDKLLAPVPAGQVFSPCRLAQHVRYTAQDSVPALVAVAVVVSREAARWKKDRLLRLVSSSTFADRLREAISSRSAWFIRYKAKPTEDMATNSANSSATSAKVLTLKNGASTPTNSEETTTTAARMKICMVCRCEERVSVGAVRSAKSTTITPTATLSN